MSHWMKFLTTASMLIALTGAMAESNGSDTFSQTVKMLKSQSSRMDAPTASLSVEEGVLKEDLSISISTIEEQSLPKLEKGMFNVTDSFSGYRFLPHGEHFQGKGAKVVLGYDRTKIPSGYTEDDIRTYYYDEVEKRWIPLQRDSVDKAHRQIISHTTHFTDMINGVIQAPESPETQGFTPTMMSDLQAADPAKKIQIIEAPQANANGSAMLQYSLEMPPARNNMAPELKLQYSSDAASGWLGEGWNLATSSISVDTRWGVPRYNKKNETETYLLDGQMLLEEGVGLAHRNPGQPRPNKEKVTFYPRKENAFSKIERIGKDPSHYIWKVTDRTGTKVYTYGAYDIKEVPGEIDDYGDPKQDTTIIGVVKGKYQNTNLEVISEWKLTRVEDIHGDYVEYEYERSKETITGEATASALYLKRVKAGNVGEEPHTVIVLNNRDKEKNIKRSEARYGYLTSSNKLLDNVEIYFEGSYLRGYQFKYKQGAFGVDLLESVTHLDSKKNPFATHNMNYNNDVMAGDGNYKPFQSKDSTLSVRDGKTDDIENFFDDYLSLTGKNLTTLGGNKSLSTSFNTYAGGGLGDYSPTKSMTGGVSYTHGKTETDGVSSFIDMNGDGLPDKVYVRKNKVYYRPQGDDGKFGKESPIEGISSISHSVNKSNAFGGKIHLGWGPAIFVGGADHNSAESETDVYFSDVNSDGMVDLVDNGVVYFNRLVDGVPTFKTTSSETGNPINAKGKIELSFDSDDEEKKAEMEEARMAKQEEKAKNSPFQDIVRVWQAPFDGKINITGDAKLVHKDGVTPSANHDGVVVSIQVDDNVIMDPTTLSDYGKSLSVKQNVEVKKGQKVLFRVQSGNQKYANGEDDIVLWSPNITYQGETNIDPNGNVIGEYSMEKCMLFSSSSVAIIDSTSKEKEVNSQKMRVPSYTSANLLGKFKKAKTSDDVTVSVIAYSEPKLSKEIKTKDEEGNDKTEYESYDNPDYVKKTLYEHTFAWDEEVDMDIDLDGANLLSKLGHCDATGNDVFLSNIQFEVKSNTNVSLENISWNPSIHYTAVDGEKDKDESMLVGYTHYSNFVNHVSSPYALPEVDEELVEDLKISPILEGKFQDNEEGKDYLIRLSLKGVNEKIASYEFKFNNETKKFEPEFIQPFKEIEYEAGKEIWFELYYDEDDLLDCDTKLKLYADKVTITQNEQGEDVETVETLYEDKFSVNMYSKSSDDGFGPLYKGWGMFSYSATIDRYEKPIVTSELGSKAMLEMFAPEEDGSMKKKENGDPYGLDDMTFVTLRPDVSSQSWIGQDPNCYICKDSMSCSRLGDQDVIVEDPLKKMMDNLSSMEDKMGSGAYAISILSESSSTAEMLGGGAFGVNLTGSMSQGNGGATQIFTDMNGDGYPDIVTKNKVQYTNTLGGFSGEVYFGNCTDHAKSNSLSFGIGGAPQHYTPNGTKSAGGSGETNGHKVQLNAISFNKAQASASANANAYAYDYTEYSMVDMNGDGLPDKVVLDENSGKLIVAYNQGYSFSEFIVLNGDKIKKSSSDDMGLGFCVDVGASSFSGGVSVNRTTSQTEYDLRDVNGDGLPDIVKVNGANSVVRFNTGNGFSNECTWTGLNALNKTTSTAASVNANATVSVTVQIVFVPVKFSGSGGGAVGYGLSGERVSYQDVNGDGFPDKIVANDDESLTVTYSSIGATNKLSSVTNPLGGSFSIDYARTKPTIDHPGGKWIMSALSVDDAVEENPSMRTIFSYENGKRDRRERDFLGFGKVTATNLDEQGNPIRSVIAEYDVSNYLTAGAPIRNLVMGASDDEKYKEDETSYVYYEVANDGTLTEVLRNEDTGELNIEDNTSLFFAPSKKSTKAYEKDNQKGLTLTEEKFGYTKTYGNLSLYQIRDKTYAEDFGYNDKIEYSNEKSGLATSLTITGTDELVYRKITAEYGDKNNPTSMTKMVRYVKMPKQSDESEEQEDEEDSPEEDSRTMAEYTFTYDKYGNMIRRTFPTENKNVNGFFEYTYDRKYQMYPERVENAFGYKSEMTDYDYRYGVPRIVRDMNGYVVQYVIDDLGRNVTIIAPNEQNDGMSYTVSYEYKDQGDYRSRYAITNHYDPQHPNNPLRTISHVDGLGRPYQVKKDAEITVNGENKGEQLIVSGRVQYDALGRTVATYQPSWCSLEQFEGIAPFGKTLLNTTTYDAIDRPLTQTLASDNSSSVSTENTTTMTYSIENNRMKTTTTDAKSNNLYSYANGAGQVVRTVKDLYNEEDGSTSEVALEYTFDPIGQVVKIKDAGDNDLLYTYNMAGNRLSVQHPSAGLTTFSYDVAGNLTAMQTSNLRKENQYILYTYEKNRLKEVLYPDKEKWRNVKYTYGSVNAEYNRVGRLALVEDESGAKEYFYGKMGEIVKQRHTLVIPNNAVATYTTEWEYDSHNRVMSMTYPDGEVVNYKYNLGGQLSSITGEKGYSYNYVKNIGYDEFEQKSYVEYGNGTKTYYTYSDTRHRLHELNVTSPIYDGSIMNNIYAYDALDNIVELTHKSKAKTLGDKFIDGVITHHYEYDEWNRLIHADGEYVTDGIDENAPSAKYNLMMKYDKLYNVIAKTLSVEQTNLQFPGSLYAGHSLNYTYAKDDPFKLENVVAAEYRTDKDNTDLDEQKINTRCDYSFDNNGNQTETVSHKWNEDGSEDLNNLSNRHLLWDMDNHLISINDNDYVSHYFYDLSGDRTVKMSAGKEDIFINSSSKLKGNEVNLKFVAYVSPYLVVKTGGEYTKHIYAGDQRIASKIGDFESFGADPRRVAVAGSNVPDANVNYGEKYENLGKRLKDNYKEYSLKADIKENKEYDNNESFCCGNSKLDLSSRNNGDATDNDNHESLVFFYHPDHLGSTTLTTDVQGNITQHVAYIPYGEVFVEERNGDWSTPYLFNAKELDEETGLYYYGARYLNPKDTRWLSVDPLFENYVGMSPYAYCEDNPIKLVDNDGMFGIEFAYCGYPKLANCHQGITYRAIKNINLNISASNRTKLLDGTFFADFTNFANDFHFDNRTNYSQIETKWTDIRSKMQMYSKSRNYEEFGKQLHNAQDFYAHSNYVDLYVEYYQATHKDMKDFDPNNIPVYDDAPEDFKTNYLKPRLRTGKYDDRSNETAFVLRNKKYHDWESDPNSHYNMNKDNNDSVTGGKKIKGTKYTYHEAAVAVATKHSEKLLKEHLEK